MDYLIQSAMAQSGQAAQESGPVATFLPLIILFVVFYFFLIRPQMKKQKEHGKMIKNLAVGDEIVTNGGVLGQITAVDEYLK
jgi:preprotein translocase subunit YajC